MKPIPVKFEDIKIETKYYTCGYSGPVRVTVIKRFYDTKCVLVTAGRSKPFVRDAKFIFDNPDMAKTAGRSWEHDNRKRKRNKKKK